MDSLEASDLYFKAAPIATIVKEYMTTKKMSPSLEASALDYEFRLLAEFNGAVLAGRETQHGYIDSAFFQSKKNDEKNV